MTTAGLFGHTPADGTVDDAHACLARAGRLRTGPRRTGPPVSWPIAAATLPFPAVLPDGRAVQDADPAAWSQSLRQISAAGFDHVDITDSWLRPGDLHPAGLSGLADAVHDAGLQVSAISAIRRSVVDPDDGEDNLAYSHRTVDAAVALGAPVVSVGLHRALTPAQRRVLWFWTVPGARDPDDAGVWSTAVRRLRELGDHCADVGIELSLEMYEDTYLGTGASAVRLLTDIDSPAVGLNPDLGNLIRLQRPVESWRSLVETTLPHANYWHVKNYFRFEDPATGAALTTPAPMELGFADYRWAVDFAVRSGYRGAFCCEHYGGDGLGVSAMNREYLLRLLPQSGPATAESGS